MNKYCCLHDKFYYEDCPCSECELEASEEKPWWYYTSPEDVGGDR